jgi:hypothetical protein
MALLQQLVEKRRLSCDRCFDGYHIGYTKTGMVSDAWNFLLLSRISLFPLRDGWTERSHGWLWKDAYTTLCIYLYYRD